MKKYSILALLIVLSLFCTAVAVQAADYQNVQGDYKIFRLGDSEEVTIDKINYLLRNSQISDAERADSGYISYITELLGKEVYSTVNFDDDDRLNSIDFQVESAETLADAIQTDYLKNLTQLFTEIYGEPAPFELASDADLDDDRQYPLQLWQLSDKYLLLSVTHYLENNYTVWLEITRGTYETAESEPEIQEPTPEELRAKAKLDFN